MSTRRARAAVLALACAVLLVGCSDTVPAPSGQRPSDAAASAPATDAASSGSPSSEASGHYSPAADPSDTASWLIDGTGIGPIRLGAAQDEVAAAIAPAYTPGEGGLSGCPAVFYSSADDSLPGLVAAGPGSDDAVVAIGGAVFGSPASDTQLAATTPRTAAGIGLGSPLEELTTAYPGIATSGGPVQGEATEYHVAAPGGDAFLIFDVADADGLVTTVGVSTAAALPSEYCG